MIKNILISALVVLGTIAAQAASYSADQQSCKVDPGFVYCMSGGQEYDMGCSVTCTAPKVAKCLNADAFEIPNVNSSWANCQLVPSYCGCKKPKTN